MSLRTFTVTSSMWIRSPELLLLWSDLPPLPCYHDVHQQDPSSLSHLLPFSPSPPTVFRRLSTRPPSLLLPRWKVSHPEPRPRWPCWAQAPPCWPGMEAHTWRVLRTRPQLLALPACRMTLVGSARGELGRSLSWRGVCGEVDLSRSELCAVVVL